MEIEEGYVLNKGSDIQVLKPIAPELVFSIFQLLSLNFFWVRICSQLGFEINRFHALYLYDIPAPSGNRDL